jgi:hypothetical protein
MQCPSCGRYLREESTVCYYCGYHTEEEKIETPLPLKKYVIASFLVIVVGLSLFYVMRYETENADKLVRAARKEVEKGSELLQKVESGLYPLRAVQVEAIDQISAEKNYASQSREGITSVLQYLDSAEPHFERAEAFLEKTEGMRLPDWYYPFIDTEKDIIQKHKEYTRVLRALCINSEMYYEFAELYLQGEQLVIDLMNDMDRGTDHLESGDYTFAFAAYDSALQRAKEAQELYRAASKIIDLPYINGLLLNLNYLERALYNLSEAAHQMELGNTEEASFLAALGTNEVSSMIHMNKLQLKIEVTEWYKNNVTDLFNKLSNLQSEIEELEKEQELG